MKPTNPTTKRRPVGRDILETMRAELDECVALLRPHYPDKDDDTLREHAMVLRPGRYERGRWPSAEEIEVAKAKAIMRWPSAEEIEAAKAKAQPALMPADDGGVDEAR